MTITFYACSSQLTAQKGKLSVTTSIRRGFMLIGLLAVIASIALTMRLLIPAPTAPPRANFVTVLKVTFAMISGSSCIGLQASREAWSIAVLINSSWSIRLVVL